MFERFTDRARRVVVLAQEEARLLQHNYIGTEHILLALVRERDGVAARVLSRYGLKLDALREEVKAMIGTAGKGQIKGHIPFTPRAKKVLELALREALQLQHNYIGTEHILLGLIREGEGVAAQILVKQGVDLTSARAAVLDLLGGYGAVQGGRRLRFARRMRWAGSDVVPELPGDPVQTTTPATDSSLAEAARLAGGQPVGSHHLMLAALSDPDSAAAKALVTLGVSLDQAREALRNADVTGTTDELAEEKGRRQMLVRVADDKLTIEVTDTLIIDLGRAALEALRGWYPAAVSDSFRGDLPVCASLSDVWQALRDSLETIQRHPEPGGEQGGPPTDPEVPGQSEDGA